MKYVGAHVSASGGVENAPVNAHKIGARAFAVFTKNQRQWKAKPLSDGSIEAFKRNCADLGYAPWQILYPYQKMSNETAKTDPNKFWGYRYIGMA